MISRVRTIEADDPNSPGSPGEDLVRFSYNGVSRLTHVTYPTPDLKLSRELAGLQAGYAGFDRFGRLKRQWWYTGSSTVKDRYEYAYDSASNRTYRDNRLASGRDQFFGYDDLHRLARYNQGNLVSDGQGGQHIVDGSATFNQAWTLDALGNWSQFKWDADGGADWHDPLYDAAGNMTRCPAPGDEAESGGSEHKLIYDAWNRMVKVTDASDTTVAQYVYDGLHRRVQRKLYVGGSLDRTLDDYYNASWQLLEVRQDSEANAHEQYVWGTHYIDAPLCRDRDADDDGSSLEQRIYYLTDANMNVTTLVSPSGTVLERYRYDPYGRAEVLEPNHAADGDGGRNGVGGETVSRGETGRNGVGGETGGETVSGEKRCRIPFFAPLPLSPPSCAHARPGIAALLTIFRCLREFFLLSPPPALALGVRTQTPRFSPRSCAPKLSFAHL